MRRIQALLVILALLAIPLALFASASCCCQITCPMCAATDGNATHYSCPMRASGTNGKAQLPDFSFAAPLAPTVPQPFFRVTRPMTARAFQPELILVLSQGFLLPPFAPPKS